MPYDLTHFPTGFITGAIMAGLLLLAGVSLGLWVSRRAFSQAAGGQPQAEHLSQLAGGLFRWTHGFAEDVSQHRNLLDDIASRYANDAAQDRKPEFTHEFYSQIVAANEQLKQRLDRAESTLKHQAEAISTYLSEARTDALTGLPNRRAFDDELERRFAEWKRYGQPVSTLLVDVDRFKAFNDGHGHLAGDAVLAQVAQRLSDTMRDSDFVARFGGEEFAMILPATRSDDAGKAAERARQAIEQAKFHYEDEPLRVTVSCGAAQALKDATPAGLVKRADMALYASKDRGRNCSHLHDGTNCLPVTPQRAAASETDAPNADEAPSADLRRACADLRQRLLEVAEGETPAPSP